MKHVDLPFGVSILAVAQRPIESTSEVRPDRTMIESLLVEPAHDGALVS
jgi:hypothetical protein